jgi:hypothetical protein
MEKEKDTADPKVIAVCTWTLDEDDCRYDTGCGEAYCFFDGTPDMNDYRYCPGCGRKLVVAPPKSRCKECARDDVMLNDEGLCARCVTEEMG